jgi:hypothetical protein
MVARRSAGSTGSRLIFAKSGLEPFQSMLEKLAHRWQPSERCLKISPEHEGAASVLSGDKRSTFDSIVDRGAAKAGDGAYLFNAQSHWGVVVDPRIGGARHFVSPGSTGVLNTGATFAEE